MTILLVGGGSGGHITPLLAVANQLKNDHPQIKVAAISEKRGIFNHMFEGARPIDDLYLINAGKYRRYYGQSLLRRLIDFKSLLFNARDIIRLLAGALESTFLLLRIKPGVVFIKGGYVGVPVGLACRLLGVPYVTHDSDAVPGLTNRLIASNAVINMVGMPPAFYPYPSEKINFVGVPVTRDYINPDKNARFKKRRELDIGKEDFLLLITGGSNGAQRLDRVVHGALARLLINNPALHIIHQVGKDNERIYEDYPVKLHSRIRVSAFFKPLSGYIDAADAVIARAGATAIAEIGHLKKPLIVVPNALLSGGHQTKNAELLEESNAAIIVNENQALQNPDLLAENIERIMKSDELRARLSKNLNDLTRKDATEKISRLLTGIAHSRKD
ncbi:UDP-N-acetylglucosamine--N-acetylmuramyl-(pentapeptide) pyrophosphoryl-undecaprenol N-acetylglucosamine transferase [Candidatus Parcubacteria bacterium]|nr:UDP-N-acetylglucosamine--N-acetylmuramyl-(pentapeptide) pyrophosphoryl-undecaprenol N-acetylglucosamine transferase [Candidatus Parcubacteria bacterium]